MKRTLMFWIVLVLAAAPAIGAPVPPPHPPQQQPEIYFTPFSHLDFFWGGTREECLARGNGIIAKAIQLAKASPKFRFLLENDVFVSNFVETHQGAAELEDLKRLVREGQIEIAPIWTGIFQGLAGRLSAGSQSDDWEARVQRDYFACPGNRILRQRCAVSRLSDVLPHRGGPARFVPRHGAHPGGPRQ